MYLVLHESRDSKKKYLVRYDITSKKFFIENEHHELMEASEESLFHLIDDYFTHEF